MNAIAQSFVAVGWLLGVPSATGLVWSIWRLCGREARPAAASFAPAPDALLLMLRGIAAAVTGLGRMLGGLEDLIYLACMAVSSLGLLGAAGLWLVGRGLLAHNVWARWCACGLLVIVGLTALMTLLLWGRRWLACGVLLFVGVALHALCTGDPAAGGIQQAKTRNIPVEQPGEPAP